MKMRKNKVRERENKGEKKKRGKISCTTVVVKRELFRRSLSLLEPPSIIPSIDDP